MERIKVLFIEDEEDLQGLFDDAVDSFNNENFTIIPNKKTNIDESIFKTILEGVDFIITDLRVPNRGEGNSIIELIRKSNMVPLFIVTGHKADLEDINETDFYRIYDKGIDNLYEKVLEDIKSIYITGITKIIGNHGKINRLLNKIIWEGGLNNIKKWQSFGDLDKSEKSLSRYILSHIHRELSGDYKDFHPEEIYLKKLGNGEYNTGAIIKKENQYYIILTPACDIAQNKMQFYKLYKINNYPTSETQLKKCKKISKFLLEKSTNFISGGCINFEESVSVPKENINQFAIVCYLSSLFLKDLVFQLGNYYSRQGSPDLFSFE